MGTNKVRSWLLGTVAVLVTAFFPWQNASFGQPRNSPQKSDAPNQLRTPTQTYDVTVGPGFTLTFSPATLNVNAGDTVRWSWAGSNHTVTSGNCCSADNKFCSPNDLSCSTAGINNAGFVYTHTFSAGGSFPYFCRLHGGSGMTGVINVTAITTVDRPVSGGNAGHFIITGKTKPNATVTIHAAPSMTADPQGIGTTQSDATGVFQYDDAEAVGLTNRFYAASLQ